jgi:hypothetical protein
VGLQAQAGEIKVWLEVKLERAQLKLYRGMKIAL